MFRLPLLLAFCTTLCAASAQDDLSAGFARLSAKERTRIAKQEEAEAAKDGAYLEQMAQAEDLFRGKRYDDAMEAYARARAMRPLNVHPKVKMDDLRILIAQRDEAAAAAPPSPTTTATSVHHAGQVPPEAVLPVAVEKDTVHVRLQAAPAMARKPAAPAPRPRTTAHAEHSAAPKRMSSSWPDGITERTVRIGRAVALDRIQQADGHVTIWRKVSHPWGEVVYFKDGSPISELTWTTEFGDH